MSPHSLLAFLTFAANLPGMATLHTMGSPSDALSVRRKKDVPRPGSTNKTFGSTNKSLPLGNRSFPADRQAAFKQCFCNELKSPPRLRLEPPPKREAPRGKVILITVCERMAGMLQASLACNQALVDRVVVITSPEDLETQRLCSSKGIEFHASKELHKNGDAFNKGAALKEMQIELHRDPANSKSIILLVDVDVCLPSDMWKLIPNELNKGIIYSVIDRCMFANHTDYSRGWPAVRGRWNNEINTLGMFQMYACAVDAPLYSEGFSNASVSDLEFASRFKNALVLPLAVNHMGVSPDYAHWQGQRNDVTSAWENAKPPPDGICPCCDINEEDDNEG